MDRIDVNAWPFRCPKCGDVLLDSDRDPVYIFCPDVLYHFHSDCGFQYVKKAFAERYYTKINDDERYFERVREDHTPMNPECLKTFLEGDWLDEQAGLAIPYYPDIVYDIYKESLQEYEMLGFYDCAYLGIER